MKAFFRLFALALALVFMLAAAACHKAPAGDVTRAPATDAPATEALLTRAPATEAPATETPTDAGNVMDLYNFNAETLLYQDMYISFTLPEGQTVLRDSTEEWGEGYIRYIFFSDPENADANTSYCVQPAGDDLYSSFTREDLELLFKLFYERSLESEVTVETLRHETVDGANFSGIIYEYSVKYDGAEIRQLLYSVVTDADLAVTVSYTFGDEAAALASMESIKLN